MQFLLDAKGVAFQHIADRRIGGQPQRLIADQIADMVGPARRRRDLGAIVAHRHQLHLEPRTAGDGPDDACKGDGAEHAARPFEARAEIDDVDRAAILGLEPRDEDRRVAAIGSGRLDLPGKAKAPGAFLLPVAAEQRAEDRVAIDARNAAPDETGFAIDQRADLAVADRPESERAYGISHW